MTRNPRCRAGSVVIGGRFPVSIQRMGKEAFAAERRADAAARLEALSRRGCDLVRFAVPDLPSAEPVAKARYWGIALRVGVNAGSLPNVSDREQDRCRSVVWIVEVEMETLEGVGLQNVIFSLKSSDIEETMKANRLFAKEYDYRLHAGATEAGLSILRTIKARDCGVNFMSCPMCARSAFRINKFLEQVSIFIQDISLPTIIAFMGCKVNGLGEARKADIEATGAGKQAVIFGNGQVIRQAPFEEAATAFVGEVKKLCEAA